MSALRIFGTCFPSCLIEPFHASDPPLDYFAQANGHFISLAFSVGFYQAGGYSGWDFWEYAPFGRMNVYPPFFQMLLAFLIKLGINPVILAKFFETVTPIVFLVVLWRFVRDNYGRISAFFILFVFVSSFDYCIFLSDHIPSTIALIFGISAFDGIFKGRLIHPVVFLALCFYTHAGVSLFIALALLLYLIFDRRHLKNICLSLSFALILAFLFL
jgi:hypothetical protein